MGLGSAGMASFDPDFGVAYAGSQATGLGGSSDFASAGVGVRAQPNAKGPEAVFASFTVEQSPPAAHAPADMISPYSEQLAQLMEMGFDDLQASAAALQAAHGDMERAIERLMSGGETSAPAASGSTKPSVYGQPTIAAPLGSGHDLPAFVNAQTRQMPMV